MKKRFKILSLIIFCSLTFSACSIQDNNIDNKGAVATVTNYLTAKKNNDFKTWENSLWTEQEDTGKNNILEKVGDLGVVSLNILKVEFNQKETNRIRKTYKEGDLKNKYGWTDDFINKNIVAVYAKYDVDYDNTKVPYDEGIIDWNFYLVRNNENSPWLIWNGTGTTK